MSRFRLWVVAQLPFILILALAACTPIEGRQTLRPVVTEEPQTKADIWKGIATDADKQRLERIGTRLAGGLQEAKRSFGREVEAEGALLQPRSALARPAPTPGSYFCRLIKLGKTTDKAVAFERFKPFFCYVEVEGDLLTIVKQTGSQRPAGRLWEDDRPDRLIYLGSLALGDEQQPSLMRRMPSATWRACSSGSLRSNGGSSFRGRRARPSSTFSS